MMHWLLAGDQSSGGGEPPTGTTSKWWDLGSAILTRSRSGAVHFGRLRGEPELVGKKKPLLNLK